MTATAKEYANWIVKNSDKRGTKEFDTVVRAFEKTRAAEMSAGDAMPGARVPEWGQESPGLYKAASVARDVLGPAVEVGLPVAGAVIGAGGTIPTGPGALVGGAAGAGLGQGLAGELTYQADVALGRRQPRSVMETITEPISNIGYGAATELAVPGILKYAGQKIGGMADVLRGARTDIRARNLLQQSLQAGGVSGVEPMRNVLRAAPETMTARQAGAQLDQSVFQAMGQRAEQQLNFVDAIKNKYANQVEADVQTLAELAGGRSATEVRAAQDAARADLNLATGPQREAALGRANVVGRLEPTLRAEASQLETAATEAVDQARRAEVAKQKAAIRAGQQLFPTGPGGELTGQPRISGRYSYMGDDMQELAERVQQQAAQGSLEFGQAARMASAAADSLANAGVKPLDGKAIAAQVRALTKDPRFAGMDERNIALNRVAADLEEWTNNQGIIDADALEAIRKNSVNAIFQTTNLAPKAKAKAVAKTMNDIRPLLIDAVENAGGVGYRQYLENYAQGMREIEKQQLLGAAFEIYQKNPKRFVDLVEGNAPKLVEKALGYKNYDIESLLDGDTLKQLRDVAENVKLTDRSEKLTKNAAEGLQTILRQNLPLLRLPPFLSAKTTIANEIIANLERKIGAKTMNRLAEAYKSGQSADELLGKLTSYERFQIATAINDPQISQLARSSVAFGLPQTIESANQLLTQPPENRNELAR